MPISNFVGAFDRGKYELQKNWVKKTQIKDRYETH